MSPVIRLLPRGAAAPVLLAGVLGALLPTSPAAAAPVLPAGFSETVAVSGLTEPTSVRFSPDGRVFVAEKRGTVKVFDGLEDPTATIVADLRANVHNFWDRGL